MDADQNAKGRYDRIRQLCSETFPDLPRDMPAAGLIVENKEDQKRFGLWIMPDNITDGSIETFLRLLVQDEKLWTMACDSVSKAVEAGANCRPTHRAKAELYTWLAWQDPPGQSPGASLAGKILDPKSVHAAGFVDWFVTLYQLPLQHQL